MNEIIELVAKAIAAAETTYVVWTAMPEDGRDVCRAMARASIEAAREPSEKMIVAGDAAVAQDSSDVTGCLFYRYYDGNAADVWKAMIDEALK